MPLHVRRTLELPPQPFEYAAQLETSFHLNLWKPLIARVKRLARRWLAKAKEEQPEIFTREFGAYKLVKAIQWGGDHLQPLPFEARLFAMEIRRRLGLGDGGRLTKKYGKRPELHARLLRFQR